MADSKKSAYGQPSSDTSFRRTWDRDEYAAKAAERESKDRDRVKLHAEAKASGKTYIREPTPEDATFLEARAQRLDVSANVGKTTLVPAGASVGKRGRGAGFYCQDCDLTFKDSIAWVDHLNSRQHLVATGHSGLVERATLEQVRERLRWLKRKKEEEAKGEELDLSKRLEIRIEAEEKEREEKREKRREARKNKKTKGEHENGDDEVEAPEEQDDMAKLMGFGGFGSTKT